ncbi:MAG TPA: PAS domain-containing protein [Bryobacteraceae bacterium]|jgi:PAS domain S-box-containing protein|nr:PAS domain-containing protein [Bryobacteraceae bacterium]
MSERKSTSWFYPKPTGDPGRDRNARSVQFACLLFAAAIGLVAALDGGRQEVPLLLFAILGLAAAALMNRAGWAVWAARTTFLAVLYAAAVLVLIAHDGFRSHAMLIFPGLLLLTVMLLDRMSYVTGAAIVLATVTAIGIAEHLGFTHAITRTRTAYGSIFFVDLYLLAIALIGSRVARDIQSNVANLRANVERFSATNRELIEAAEAQRISEIKVREGEQRLRMAKDAARLGIYDYHVATGEILWDARVREFWGVGPDEPVTIDTFFSGLHPDDRAKTQAILARALDPAGNGEYYAEYRVISKADGTERWVAATGQVFFENGRPVHMIGTGQDISERKRAEAELRESEERFRIMADTAPVMIWVTGPDKACTFVNRTWLNFTGRTLEEELGFGWAACVHPEDRDRNWAAFCAAFDARQTFQVESRWRRADGEYRLVLCTGVPRFEPAGNFVGYIGSKIDITDLQSEKRFRQLAENIDGVFWMMDLATGRELYVSPAFEKIWGVSPAPLYGDGLWLADTVHPEDRDRFLAFCSRMKSEPAEETYRILRPDGSLRWIHDRAFLIHDREGKPYRVAGIAEDVTRQRQLEEELRQTYKMEAIGRLAGGIAHDFNNLLTVAGGYLHLVLDATPPSDPRHEKLRHILGATTRASTLTSQLLAFGRKQMVQPRAVNVNRLLTNMEPLLRPVMGEQVRLTTDLARDLPCVTADPNQLEQVFLNLAANARDAMPQGGEFRIRTSFAEERAGSGRESRPCVHIQVSDTGCGMSPSVLEHIFEPFFTTKGVGKGTGLGLSTVYGIVQQNCGTIHVSSSPGRGATFEILLPAAPELECAKPDDSPLEGRRGTETVLVAEDEPAVRMLVCEMLVQLGYTVLQAPDGREALRLLGQHRPIHVLLTDVIMPAMGGPELAERAKSLVPGIKVIYMSGYTDDTLARHGLPGPDTKYIQKPFSPGALAEQLRQALSPAPNRSRTQNGSR